MKRTFIIRGQKGYSFIEMMVALAIGWFVVGTAAQLMISNSHSAIMSEFLANAQENGRNSLEIISREFRKSGFIVKHGSAFLDPFYLEACEGDPVCTVDGGGTNSDRVAIQYEPLEYAGSSTGKDCTGENVTLGDLTVDVYFVALDATNNNVSTLFCRGYNPVTSKPRGDAIALVPGVDRLQVVYGIASSGTNIINQYVTASSVGDWRQVLGMRVSVLVNSGEPSRLFDISTRTYNLLNSGDLSFEDQIPRYVYSTAITLNNAGLK